MDETTTCITNPDGLVACFDVNGAIIAEDDPRWDCATMGNLVCGPLPAAAEIGTALVIERPAPESNATELARTGSEASIALVGLTLVLLGRMLVCFGKGLTA